MPGKHHTFFATCPKGMEELLRLEILALTNLHVEQARSGVFFKGDLRSAYTICLWSRLANRVLLSLARFEAETPDDLYARIYQGIPWDDHMTPDEKIAVDFTANQRNTFHSHYAALRVKDGVVDQFRAKTGNRPSVDTENPDIRINVHMNKTSARVFLDLSGDSLHKRCYRKEGGPAPLKENLAAAILIRAKWPSLAREGVPLVDPLCGSGTLLIEGALMAMDRAPGLLRPSFGFTKWKQHDRALWQLLINEAETRAKKRAQRIPRFFWGFDRDPDIIAQARANAVRAGLEDVISFRTQDLNALRAPETPVPGLLIANPPYGERMGRNGNLETLYETLGNRLKQGFQGWSAGVFTARPDLAKKIGFRAVKRYRFFNGPIPCNLFNFEIRDEWVMHQRRPGRRLHYVVEKPEMEPGAEMFRNRLRKNLRILGKWARKEGITCYRLYDADMPEYAVAIDVYEGRLHVQEYRAPATVSPEKARKRLKQVLNVLPGALNVSHEKIVFKVREKKKRTAQYGKFDSQGRFFEVRENGLRFLVNLTDYLDTGLFLDQRRLRKQLGEASFKKKVLNLFCYTATATVYAAKGGAAETTSVDMSGTYLGWARKNLALNRCTEPKHRLAQADCLEWIDNCREVYDLIYLAPPTFSNSKRMRTAFDVQRDHMGLLTRTLRLLAPGGLLMFSCNRRKFRLDPEASDRWLVRDISSATLPKDFQRNPHIHNVFEIRKPAMAMAGRAKPSY